ncbi:MAG: hypothetical protein EU548_01140 [Promethearchaeota archaeon]|nr:MAG: hypothetical protein EU548_01140 [Candidatus Lokiarchaeota archaeon]
MLPQFQLKGNYLRQMPQALLLRLQQRAHLFQIHHKFLFLYYAPLEYKNCSHVSITDIAIQTTYRGLRLANCLNVSITNSSFDCVDSPSIISSRNITISNSEFIYSSPNYENSTDCIISYSEFFRSSIYLRSSDANLISHNLLNQTQTGIYLETSSDNNLVLSNTIFYFSACFYNSSDCVGNQWINNTCTQI